MVVILDNGAGNIKAGFDRNDKPTIVCSNVAAKINKTMQYLISDQIYDARNGSMLNFSRPFDRGYLNNWQCEIDVWTYVFGASGLNITPAENSLIVTEPPFNPPTLQCDMNEVIFEYFNFKEYLRRPASWFSMYEFAADPKWNDAGLDSCTIVDTGFSFSHSTPFINSKCQQYAVKRVNIGGKLLTNYLKEVVSYRQWNMMDEFLLMDQVKEDLCYISQDFMPELKAARPVRRLPGIERVAVRDPMGGLLKKQYVLPDFHTIMKGFVKPDDAPPNPNEQVLVMETERFCVPELLFRPSDLPGLEQAGVAEATWQSISALGQVEQGLAAAKIVLTGGNVNIPYFRQRFEQEIRPFIPDIYPVQVLQPDQPELYAWRGAARLARDLDSGRSSSSNSKEGAGTGTGRMVSRAEYLENGHSYCNEKFAAPLS